MRVLIDINHPAHVHLFKNLYFELRKRNVFVLVAVTQKDIAKLLLEKYNIPYVNMGSYGRSTLSKAINLPLKSIYLRYLAWKHKIDVLFGVSFRVSHASFLTKKKSYVLDDTEHAKQEILLYKYFATKIVTPKSFDISLGRKHIRYNGFHELAYLHPNYFKPKLETLKSLGLKESDVFFVLRFVGWEAMHDIGHNGISIENKRRLIKLLNPLGRVIISSEKKLDKEFEKYRMSICPTKMHDLLYYCSLFVGDGGTMASESAVLGTPSVHVSSLDAGVLKEQVNYNLLTSLRNDKELIKIVEKKLPTIAEEKKQNRLIVKKMLEEQQDVTSFMLDLVLENKIST